MKSLIKRSLFVGIALGLVALTARRFGAESEVQGELDKPETPAPRLGPDDGNPATRVLPPKASTPMVAPTVTFSGTVVRNGPRLALRETAGVLYPLHWAGRISPFEGEDVRVTGKLDLDTRLLYVDAIEHAAL